MVSFECRPQHLSTACKRMFLYLNFPRVSLPAIETCSNVKQKEAKNINHLQPVIWIVSFLSHSHPLWFSIQFKQMLIFSHDFISDRFRHRNRKKKKEKKRESRKSSQRQREKKSFITAQGWIANATSLFRLHWNEIGCLVGIPFLTNSSRNANPLPFDQKAKWRK